jgi:hypothetical protein
MAIPQGPMMLFPPSNGGRTVPSAFTMKRRRRDPTDGCTFWYTQEYYAATGSFNWTTRIGSFKFNSCKGRSK